jgi:hypothetical protein
MTDYNQFHDSLAGVPPPPKKMPDMINVLTILTFIACAISVLYGTYSYFTVCKSVEVVEQSMGKLSDGPMAGMMDNVVSLTQKECELRMPILLVTILSNLLCFVGALQMRQMKKVGFFVYLVGEVAGPAIMLILLGSGMMSGLMGGLMVAGFIFPIVFIILYATQLKHMK